MNKPVLIVLLTALLLPLSAGRPDAAPLAAGEGAGLYVAGNDGWERSQREELRRREAEHRFRDRLAQERMQREQQRMIEQQRRMEFDKGRPDGRFRKPPRHKRGEGHFRHDGVRRDAPHFRPPRPRYDDGQWRPEELRRRGFDDGQYHPGRTF